MKTIEKVLCLLICITLICSCVFAEDFSEFDETVYVATLDSLSGEELLAYIDSNKEYSGIAIEKAYIEIRENAEFFTDEVQYKALAVIEATDMSNMVVAETNRVIADALLVSAFSYCENWNVLDTLIEIFHVEISAAGGIATGYLSSTHRTEIAHNLMQAQPFAQLAEFVARLNMLIGTPTSSPSYGGGGGGGSISIPNTQWRIADEGVLLISGTSMDNYSKTSQIPWYSKRLDIKEIVIGEYITNIGDKAFYGCINAKKITIPEGVTSIGTDAFKNCDEMTICGRKGSYAEVYAAENQIPFIVNTKTWNGKYMTVDFAENTVKWYFDVTVDDYSDSATVFAAIYDAEGKVLLTVSEQLVSDDITSLSLAKNSDAVYAQIFVWNSLLQPITAVEKIDL